MAYATHFDADLIRRYDLAGPRYTSYPTAPQFSAGFREAEYREHALGSNEDPIPRPLSLYLHIPFCASPCFYCGCHRIIVHPTHASERSRAYLERMLREIEMQGALFDRDRDVTQIHLGGGTPTFLSNDQLGELMRSLDRHFHLARDETREFSIEVDPRTVDADKIRMLADLGFNRISLGVQDFNPEVQKAVNREQTLEETLGLMEAARQAGFFSINLDLIYGLPMQTATSFRETLAQVIEARPDRIATYSYAHLPHLFKAQRKIHAEDLPSPVEKLDLLGLTVAELTAGGYHYIGMDHFALPNDELVRAQLNGSLHRNFNGYSTHAECDLIGMGCSSISSVGDSYSQNAKDLIPYYAEVDHGRLPVVRGLSLSHDDRLRREVINGLMCRDELPFGPLERAFEIDFASYFRPELGRLRPLERDGLVEVGDRSIRITASGRLLLRAVAMVFDAFLKPANVTEMPRYSRVI
ncbi:MAG TPA: oxygen-independent coproporphyrinogen III oxidase [Xanthomonadaceae bacterium]|nr:oxygen-independent coproporphyrinogen III oxidase [Xanthomonadaceae bacterium]